MRILNGTRVIDAEPGWREALLHGGRRVVIDLGAGDGRFAYESARNDAASVYVDVHPVAAPLAPHPPTRKSAPPPGEPLPVPDETYIDPALVPAYGAAGLAVEERRRLSREEALAIPSTWGRRLLHARPRDVFLLRGSVR